MKLNGLGLIELIVALDMEKQITKNHDDAQLVKRVLRARQSETGFVCMSGVVNQTGHRPLSPPAHSDNRTSQSAFGAQPARTAVSRYTFDLFECQQTFTSSVNKQNVRGNSIKCFYYFNYSSLL